MKISTSNGKTVSNLKRKPTEKKSITKPNMQTKQAVANHRPDTTGMPTNAGKLSGERRYFFVQSRANYKSSLGKADFLLQTLLCSRVMASSWPKNLIYISSQ